MVRLNGPTTIGDGGTQIWSGEHLRADQSCGIVAASPLASLPDCGAHFTP